MTGTGNDGEFQEFIDPKKPIPFTEDINQKDYTKKIYD
jgi:hypothetical protein